MWQGEQNVAGGARECGRGQENVAGGGGQENVADDS